MPLTRLNAATSWKVPPPRRDQVESSPFSLLFRARLTRQHFPKASAESFMAEYGIFTSSVQSLSCSCTAADMDAHSPCEKITAPFSATIICAQLPVSPGSRNTSTESPLNFFSVEVAHFSCDA